LATLQGLKQPPTEVFGHGCKVYQKLHGCFHVDYNGNSLLQRVARRLHGFIGIFVPQRLIDSLRFAGM